MNEATRLNNYQITFDGPQTDALHKALFRPPEAFDHFVVASATTLAASAQQALSKLRHLNLSLGVQAQLERHMGTLLAPYGPSTNDTTPPTTFIYTTIAIDVTRKA